MNSLLEQRAEQPERQCYRRENRRSSNNQVEADSCPRGEVELGGVQRHMVVVFAWLPSTRAGKNGLSWVLFESVIPIGELKKTSHSS